MKIGNAHRNKIWKSLVEFRSLGFTPITIDSQDLQKSASGTSTISLSSQNSLSQNSTYNPGFYEVTRYTFKHTISLTADEKVESYSKRIKLDWRVFDEDRRVLWNKVVWGPFSKTTYDELKDIFFFFRYQKQNIGKYIFQNELAYFFILLYNRKKNRETEAVFFFLACLCRTSSCDEKGQRHT